METAVEVNTTDPWWPAWLVDSVTLQAREGAQQLVAQIAPQLPPPGQTFVQLADVIPRTQSADALLALS